MHEALRVLLQGDFDEQTVQHVLSIMEVFSVDMVRAMNVLKIPPEDWERIQALAEQTLEEQKSKSA